MLINVDKCNSYTPRCIGIFNTFKKVKGLWDQRFWTLLLWMNDFCFCPTRVPRGSPFLAPSFCRSCSCHDDPWPPSLPHIWTTLLGFPPAALLTPYPLSLDGFPSSFWNYIIGVKRDYPLVPFSSLSILPSYEPHAVLVLNVNMLMLPVLALPTWASLMNSRLRAQLPIWLLPLDVHRDTKHTNNSELIISPNATKVESELN